jgi:AraC family transcriptional activator of pobA
VLRKLLAHTHDFLALAYFESGGDSASGFREAESWAVSFPPEILGPRTPDIFLSWRAHPLLFPFVGARPGTPIA